jgi:RimJ/RimL family protein N-acetyltransferase
MSNLAGADQAGKVLERSVVGSLGGCGENACRQFPARNMIVEAVTANAFTGAGFIGAVASVAVTFLFAIHQIISFRIACYLFNKRFRRPFISAAAGFIIF